MDKTVINFRLSELRKAKHITQGELAEIVGTSFQTISKWENGITMPDITVLPILAAFFEVSIDELLGIKPLKGDVYSSEETGEKKSSDNALLFTVYLAVCVGALLSVALFGCSFSMVKFFGDYCVYTVYFSYPLFGLALLSIGIIMFCF